MESVGAGFGEELRLERERRGISLEALCAETKVNSRHFDALERGDYQALPGGVFRRGIVRAYLVSLGLDEEAWMPRFDASYAEQARATGAKLEPNKDDWAKFATNVKKNRKGQRRGTTARWLGILAMVVVLVAAAWGVWHFLLHSQMQR